MRICRSGVFTRTASLSAYNILAAAPSLLINMVTNAYLNGREIDALIDKGSSVSYIYPRVFKR